MNKITKTFKYGDHEVKLETGGIARQATGAVMISLGDTAVLVTVVGKKEAVADRDFFPLTVNYQERYYAAGKLPGGFFKREGRPGVHETLISRLIDRPLRPLFPEGFTNEVQIVASVMSMDPEVSADIPAIIGSAAALAISGIPFNGPIAAARVGYADNNYLLNPSVKQLEDSKLDLVVAGTEKAVLMVESEAKELPEEVMLGAVMYGHQQMQVAIKAIQEFAAEVGTKAWEWQPPAVNTALVDEVAKATEQFKQAYAVKEKTDRHTKLDTIRAELVERLVNENESSLTAEEVINVSHDLEKKLVRQQILDNQPRIDGRDTKTVRPINIEVGALPRTHGSAIFTRGETQAIVITTLGTARDAQIIDIPASDSREHFLLHYNFPPYCVGETGMMGSPKRREIGHGALAKRAMGAVIPNKDSYPYVIRIVSEITESNGSSSMASVCGSSLSLMDAGVPIKAPVAGIAMGLIKEGNQHAVLTDILGDEDHLGDMDFKVAGTKDGITALQMDIKIDGITEEIMQTALAQAKDGRMHILDLMIKAIDKPRETISQYAPQIKTIKIKADKIRDVIGKGGVTIRSIVEETGANIDIADDGTVTIAAVDKAASDAAEQRISDLTAEPEIGKTYNGKVVKILDFGAFVAFLGTKEGLVHISQIAAKRVEQVTDYLQEGQEIRVKVIEIDRQGRVRLSMKEAD